MDIANPNTLATKNAIDQMEKATRKSGFHWVFHKLPYEILMLKSLFEEISIF